MENYDTLAAAYAESGDFKEAIRIQKYNIEVFTKKNRTTELLKAQKKLEAYKQSKPWREIYPALKR